MKKRLLFCLVLVMLVAGGVFAQNRPANIRDNWIQGELGLLGVGVRYERMLNSQWSVGANIYWSSFFIIWNELGIDATARYYPWGTNFFVGLGLGFHTHTGTAEETYKGKKYSEWVTITGVALTPEVGWKIDVGEEGGFYVQPGIKIPITIGKQDAIVSGAKTKTSVGFGVVPYCGLGYAF